MCGGGGNCLVRCCSEHHLFWTFQTRVLNFRSIIMRLPLIVHMDTCLHTVYNVTIYDCGNIELISGICDILNILPTFVTQNGWEIEENLFLGDNLK